MPGLFTPNYRTVRNESSSCGCPGVSYDFYYYSRNPAIPSYSSLHLTYVPNHLDEIYVVPEGSYDSMVRGVRPWPPYAYGCIEIPGGYMLTTVLLIEYVQYEFPLTAYLTMHHFIDVSDGSIGRGHYWHAERLDRPIAGHFNVVDGTHPDKISLDTIRGMQMVEHTAPIILRS